MTFSAAWHKVFDPNPLIGMLAHARQLAAGPAIDGLQRRIFNDRLDAAVCGLLVALVSVIVIESALQWMTVISGRASRARRKPHLWRRHSRRRRCEGIGRSCDRV